MSQLINQIRFYHYISGVLANQQADPLCSICKAYANTVSAVKTDLARMVAEHAAEIHSLSGGPLLMLEEAHKRTASIKVQENTTGQKKAGNCKMPEGVCFIKLSKATLSKIQQPKPRCE